MKTPRFEPAWGDELLSQVDAYLEGLYAGLDTEDGDPFTLTGYQFCGCEVCLERERTFAIVQYTLEGAEAGRVRLEEVS